MELDCVITSIRTGNFIIDPGSVIAQTCCFSPVDNMGEDKYKSDVDSHSINRDATQTRIVRQYEY